MQTSAFSSPAFRALAMLFVVTFLVVSVSVVPGYFGIKAESSPSQSTSREDRGLPNFDIRDNDDPDALAQVRSSAGLTGREASTSREEFANGEAALRARMPDVQIERSKKLGNAGVISPNVGNDEHRLLSGPGGADRGQRLRSFLKENRGLFGLKKGQEDELEVAADYSNPDGDLSFARLEQKVGGVPVFAGEVKAGFNRNGEMIRVVNDLAPGLDYNGLSPDFGNPADAVRNAAGHVGHKFSDNDLIEDRDRSNGNKAVFGKGEWPTTAEKFYFPTEDGVAVPAWRVLIWEPVDAYYVIVDAAGGRMLWRKNITEEQSQPITLNVYRNTASFLDVADSPAPGTPGPNSPDGTQSPVTTRQDVTLIGNESDLSFNQKGWVTDGTNNTDGNAVQAGIDRDGTNGVDAPQTGGLNRTFTSTWNPPPGSPAPGDSPLTAQAQRGAVIQMFYVMNRYHDALYKLGFTEAAFNFQNENFGKGGLGNDRVSAEGQDSSGTDNANFSTPADGQRGRMQMYLWVGPNPDRDGTADADIIIHEVTHGTSNRLHGNSSGLSTPMARGMGEGWGDFYAHTLLAERSDPIDGIYTIGGYATYLAASGYVSNYYHGIRRFPKAVIGFTGPNGKPHNPLTFRYVNSNCNTLIGSTTTNPNSAYPRGPFGSSTCDQVHNLGEVWSSALWEVRALMVQRLGFDAGTLEVLKVVTNGMKLSPTGPNFLEARDAIISAASALSAADAADVREGFRRRGMGFGASIQNEGSSVFTNRTAVTESFAFWPGDPTPTPTPTPTATPTPTPNPTPTPTPTPVPGATVSGTVLKANGKGFGGATVTISGSGFTQTTTTSGNGSYSFSNVPNGSGYTVTPSANRSTFTPMSRTIDVSGNTPVGVFTANR